MNILEVITIVAALCVFGVFAYRHVSVCERITQHAKNIRHLSRDLFSGGRK